MNATNLPAEAALDSAYLEAAKALMMIRNAQKGPKDADMYGCTLHFVGVALKHMMADMDAAGAQAMDDEDTPAECPVEYEALYAMDKFMRESDADLPAHKQAGYVERLYEICDIRKSA